MIHTISTGILHTVCMFAVIWNVVAVSIDRNGTLSKVILGGCVEHPSISFVLGFLFGHLLWPMMIVNELGYWKYSLPFAVVLLLVIIIVDFTIDLPKVFFPMIYFLIAIPVGHFLWPQKVMI